MFPKTIDHCNQYIQSGDTWKCKVCEEGYKLSSGLWFISVGYDELLCKPEIDHCIEYDIVSQDSKCKVCEIGYSLDSRSDWTVCDSGYISIITYPKVWAREILNCKEYKITEEGWKCKGCDTGYTLYNSDSLCITEIKSCLTYTPEENIYICEECK
jgi:hypothetical protein